MSIKVLAIINPTSGKGKTEKHIEEIKENIEKQNMEVEIKLTEIGHNAKKIVEENGQDKDLILVCGGDGTLNETVSAMMKKKIDKEIQDISLSFIPMGTTNDLARTLNMPIGDISITKNLLEAKARLVDIGRFNQDKYLCYVAAFGLITDVSYITSQEAKHKYGRLAYYINALKEIIHIPTYKIKVTYDGKEFEDEVIYGGISNSESIAGFKWFERGEILLDDGKFEGIFIKKPKHITGYFKILQAFFRKQYTENKYIHFVQASHIEIQAQEKLKWTIDGEYAGEFDKIDIQNKQRAIEFAI